MRTGLLRILLLAALTGIPLEADAASWQWSASGGREQVVVRLDSETNEEATVRTSPTSLDIQLNAPPSAVSRQGAVPASTGLVSNVESVGNALRLSLRDPAFGYIVQRRDGNIILEIFSDPLGARWQPSDSRQITPPVPTQAAPVSAPAAVPASPATEMPLQGTSGQSPAVSFQPVAPVTPAQVPVTTPEVTSPAPPGQTVAGQTLPEQNVPAAATESATQTPQPMTPVQPTQQPVAPQGQQTVQPDTAGEAGGSVQAATQEADPQSSSQPPSQPNQTDMTTSAGQGTIVAPRTSARDVQVHIQIDQPAQQPVNVGTPAGMPGGEHGSLAPLAVSSGADLPVQADPPGASGPSNTDLSTITQRIESVPAQPDQPGQMRGSLNSAVLSSPTAPPSVQETTGAAQVAPAIQTEPVTPPSEAGVHVSPDAAVDVNVQVTSDATAPQPVSEGTPPSVAVEVNVEDHAQTSSDRLITESGSGLRARFNAGGPDVWPKEEGLSSAPEDPGGTFDAQVKALSKAAGEEISGSLTVPPEPVPAGSHGAAVEAQKPVEPEILYVDEEGNPVPKPLDVNAMLAQARQLIQSMQYEPALEILEQVKAEPLAPEKREELLYLISDATTGKYNGKWLEGYEPIVSTTSEAMNANLRSPQVPRALERLGMINLRTGNQQDAEGYFGVLHHKYSYDPLVPDVYYALGKDQLERGQYAEAVQSFQLVMQGYPESQVVRDSARDMAEALYKQGHYERAMTIIDFVDRRWPRIYIDDPSYLLLVADTQFRRGRLDDSLQTYWIYYNLVPDNPGNDQLLLNMGTIYLLKGDLDSANTLYAELLRKFPDSQYAPLAVLRQGEEGVFEGNLSVEALFGIFARPNLRTLPEVAYERLLKDYPASAEAVSAALRLAVWRLWNREYSTAMNLAEQFLQQHGDSPYAPRADEVILRAFAVELAMDLEEQNYDRILSRWERFPQVRGAYATLDDELRVALARAQINRGNEAEGFALLRPFLERPQDPKYGEYVYKLNLARALRNEDWQGIVDLGAMVENWNFPQAEQNEQVYAMAIARENMGQTPEAVPLWAQLYSRDDIPLYQKAYANYFMARDAERRRSIHDAYELNKATLRLFERLAVEQPERADSARVQESLVALMDVTEVANRFAEALEWAEEYSSFVPEDSTEYAAFRFRLARLYRKMGDLARWQFYLEDIIQREPESVFGQMAASELRTHQVARDLSRFTPD